MDISDVRGRPDTPTGLRPDLLDLTYWTDINPLDRFDVSDHEHLDAEQQYFQNCLTAAESLLASEVEMSRESLPFLDTRQNVFSASDLAAALAVGTEPAREKRGWCVPLIYHSQRNGVWQ